MMLLFVTAASAQQKKYLYVDSSLLKNESTSYDAVEEVVPADDSGPAEDHTLNAPDTTGGAYGTDTTLYLNGLSLSPDSPRKWRNEARFAYAKNLDSLLRAAKENENKAPPEKPSLLAQFLSSALVEVLLWIAAILFVGFIIFRLFLADGVFRRDTTKSISTHSSPEEEEITSATNFDALITQALQKSDFRQAVRYQYLRSLYKLADRNLLVLAPDKTNYQYVRELKERSLQQDFSSLTLNYEYVWYGEFNVDVDLYHKIESGFKKFNQQI